jgi:hypothetical protein
MSCTIYIVSCNFATHAIYLLALTSYKYSELQVFFATQKLNCKANCKTSLFFHNETLKFEFFFFNIKTDYGFYYMFFFTNFICQRVDTPKKKEVNMRTNHYIIFTIVCEILKTMTSYFSSHSNKNLNPRYM